MPRMEADNQWRLVKACLSTSGAAIPVLSEIAVRTGITIEDVKIAAQSAVKPSQAVSGVRPSLRPALTIAWILPINIIQLDEANAEISVAVAKQQWGTGRNLTIEILEYFDEIRLHSTAQQYPHRLGQVASSAAV